MWRAALVLCALALGALGDKELSLQTHTELANLAANPERTIELWQLATDLAAESVIAELKKHGGGSDVELQGTDLEALQIWHGQSVRLGLEAGAQRFKYEFVVQSEPEWRRLAEVLPTAQGGLLPAPSWDSLDRDWLAPVARGSLLPDFALEGPVDVYLAKPTALQLFLPHSTDAGTVHRVMLRQGAAVMVRGARAVRLRRGLDLPPISLSEFASIVTTDAQQQQPLGVMHMLAGVQAAAASHWNASHPDQSLGLVALELDLSPRGAAMLAAPGADGGVRRLRVRAVKQGVVELLPRDAPPEGASAAAGAVALPWAAAGAAGEGAWPLTSVHPSQLQSYERLLRQVISSKLFAIGPGSGSGPSVRVAQDVQLRLLETEAQATTLLKMQLDLVRRPLDAAAKQQQQQQRRQREAAAGDPAPAGGAGGGAVAVMDDPPDPMAMIARAATRVGPHESWVATVQVTGDAQRGTLKFVPLLLERVGAAHDTVQLAPDAQLAGIFGPNVAGVNVTAAAARGAAE